MYTEQQREQVISDTIDKLANKDRVHLDATRDLLTWGFYGPSVFSQFGMALAGFVFRQLNGNCQMTVKVVEQGVPLVAFVSSHTTTGCIEQMFDLLWAGRLKWQKDKYPWI